MPSVDATQALLREMSKVIKKIDLTGIVQSFAGTFIKVMMKGVEQEDLFGQITMLQAI
jgi:hypothetical protein